VAHIQQKLSRQEMATRCPNLVVDAACRWRSTGTSTRSSTYRRDMVRSLHIMRTNDSILDKIQYNRSEKDGRMYPTCRCPFSFYLSTNKRISVLSSESIVIGSSISSQISQPSTTRYALRLISYNAVDGTLKRSHFGQQPPSIVHQNHRLSFHSSVTVTNSTSIEKNDNDSSDTTGTSSSNQKEYSTTELTDDAKQHKTGLNDPTIPPWQNPLHHDNEEMKKIYVEDFESPEAFQQAILPAPSPENNEDNSGSLSSSSVTAPEYLHELADEIVHLTMLEMSELINKIANHYGFHEAMLSPEQDSAGGGSGGGADVDGGSGEDAIEDAVVTEKINFDIKLVTYDASAKIKIIKEVRSLASLGLKEAKEMVEGVPKTILKDIKKEQAEEIKVKLEELGATVEIV
jgi:large subunit ribosomal protein L7/L12